jgi:hypothetical protein
MRKGPYSRHLKEAIGAKPDIAGAAPSEELRRTALHPWFPEILRERERQVRSLGSAISQASN